MTYTPEEEMKIKKVLATFHDYIEASSTIDGLFSKKVGYLLVSLGGGDNPSLYGTDEIESASGLCLSLMEEIAQDCIEKTNPEYDSISKTTAAEKEAILERIRTYTRALPEYAYLEEELFSD